MRGLLNSERLAELGPVLTRIVAVAGLLAFVVAGAAILSRSGDTYEVKAVFEDVRGLIPGGEVRAGGERLGTVEDIELDERGLPVVTMSLDGGLRLRRGSYANIRLASNVGGVNRFVDLELGRGPPLPDGATLGPSRTDQPVDLDLALSDLDPETRAQVAAVLARLDASLRGRGDELARTLRHSDLALNETAELLSLVNADTFALRTLVSQGRAVVGALASSPQDIGSAAERLASALSITAARQRELGRATRSLGPGLATARGALVRLEGAIPNLHRLAIAARPAVEELTPTARRIRPAIAALRPLLRQARKLIAASPSQLRRLRPVLRDATPLLGRLEPLLRRGGPFVDYLRAWAPEVLGFFTLWGDAGAGFDANGNLVRLGFTPLQGPRHANLLDPWAGPVPGLVRRPFYRTPGSLEGEPWLDYATSFIGGGRGVDSFLGEEAP